MKIYNFISDINKAKYITTTIKLAFWARKGDIDKNETRHALNAINNQNHFNKIICNDDFQEHFISLKIKGYEFVSLGLIRLDYPKDEADAEIELYRLLNSSSK